jgi:hypothetical protein
VEQSLRRGKLYDLTITDPAPGHPSFYRRVSYVGRVFAQWLTGEGPATTWVCFADKSSTEIRLKQGTFTAEPTDKRER